MAAREPRRNEDRGDAMRALGWAALVLGLAGCRTEQTIITPDPHLERMLNQPKVKAYASASQLPSGMAMQPPPEGALPTDTELDAPIVTTGLDPTKPHARGAPSGAKGAYVEKIPIPVDRGLLEAGRERFELFCAACHGILGDGESVVASKMSLRQPPSLHGVVRTYPDGRIFDTIRHGYGLMPSYEAQISVNEAWGIVAYVRALQLARHASVADLPPDIRAHLAENAP